MGIPLANLDTATYVFPQFDSPRDRLILLVTTRRPYDKARFLAAIKPEGPGQTVAGLEVHPANPNDHVVFVNDRCFCMVEGSTLDGAAALAQRMVAAARPTREPGMTYYQVFVGKGAAWERQPRGLRFTDFTDGTSNTLMVAEAAEPVIWTKPDDLAFDPDKPLPKLGGHFPGGFNAAFMDGSVRFLHQTMSEKTLKALITRNGGEVVRPDDQ